MYVMRMQNKSKLLFTNEWKNNELTGFIPALSIDTDSCDMVAIPSFGRIYRR